MPPRAAATSTITGSPTDGNLLNVNVDLNGQLHLASPIAAPASDSAPPSSEAVPSSSAPVATGPP